MDNSINKYYIAYGMNLDERYMQPVPQEAKPIEATMIKDYKLVFRDGLATIEPCKGNKVPVGVWAITKRKERDLDIREGYPSLYRKELFDVDVAGHGTVKAMVYIMNGSEPLSPPSDYYESIIREGYENWNLDTAYLDKAIMEAEITI